MLELRTFSIVAPVAAYSKSLYLIPHRTIASSSSSLMEPGIVDLANAVAVARSDSKRHVSRRGVAQEPL